MALIGRQLTSGNYLKLDDISSQFNSSTRTFNLTTAGQPFYPGSVFSVLISVGGSIQEPATSYTIDQATITFASAPTSGSAFFGIVLGLALNIGVPADGTVTGTKLSSPFNYNSGLLYLDTTNNRVGILSTSPTVALDVIGNSRVSGITNLNGLSVSGISTLGKVQISSGIVTASSGIVTYYGDGSKLSNIISGVSISTNTTNQSQYLTYVTGTGSTTGFGITTTGLVFNPSSGNIGIGTTNPTSKLHVVGGVRVTGIVTATTFVGALTGTASSTTNIPNLTGAISSNNTTTSLGSFTSAQLATALTDETGSGANVFATSPVLVTPVLGAAIATSIVVSSGSTFSNGPVLIGTGTSTGTASQPLQVTGGAYVSGSVGIGTASPAEKLHIHSDLAVIRLSGSAASQTSFNIRQGIVGTSNAGFSIYDVNNSATRFAIDPSGNIGIGTNSPSSVLDVASSNSGITLTNTGASNKKWRLGGSSTGSFVITETGVADRLTINTTGYFGFGTNNPAAFLDVSDGTVANTKSPKVYFCGENGGDQVVCEIRQGRYNKDVLVVSSNQSLSANLFNAIENGTSRFVITGAGNVGIRTTSPGQALDVKGIIQTIGANGWTTNGDTAWVYFGDNNNRIGGTRDGTIGFYSDYAPLELGAGGGVGSSSGTQLITFKTGTSERARIDSNGRVGIGITSPSSLLHLAAASGTIQTQFNNGGTSSYIGHDSGFTGLDIAAGGGIRFRYFNGASYAESTRIDSSGRLLVGTSTARTSFGNTAATSALQVEGINGNTGRLSVITNFDTATNGAAGQLVLARSGATSIGSNTLVAANNWLGLVSFQGSDGTEFVEAAEIKAEVDGTPGTNDMPGRLVFSTTADGATSPTERMRITNDGRLLVGYTSSAATIAGTISAVGYAGKQGINNAPDDNIINFFFNGNLEAWVDTTNLGNVTIVSDYRIKKDIISQVELAIPKIKALRPVTYQRANYKELFTEDGVQREGFIAHELALVIPSAVSGEKDAENRIQSLNLDAVVSVLTKALQEAIAKIETLEARLTAAGIE